MGEGIREVKSRGRYLLDVDTLERISEAQIIVVEAGELLRMADGGPIPRHVLDTIPHHPAHIGPRRGTVSLPRPAAAPAPALGQPAPPVSVAPALTPSEGRSVEPATPPTEPAIPPTEPVTLPTVPKAPKAPEDLSWIDTLSYRQAQHECRTRGLNGKGSRASLLARIREAVIGVSLDT